MVLRPTDSQTPHRGPTCWVRKGERPVSAWIRVFCVAQGWVRLDPVLRWFRCCCRSGYEVSHESPWSWQERCKIGTPLVPIFPAYGPLSFH